VNVGVRVPGPTGAAATAVLPRFLADPYGFLHRCARRYGDVYRLPLGLTSITVVNHPDHVGHFLTENAKNYEKGRMNWRLRPALGDGIPISEGDKWRRTRRLLNPMFARKSLDGLTEIIAHSIRDTLERWDRHTASGAVVDMTDEIGILTMQILQRAMFSSSVHDDAVPGLVERLRAMSLYMGGLMATVWAPTWMPVPFERSGRRAVAELHATIDGLIAERRTHPVEAPDLLNLLLATRDENGTPLSGEQLRDEVMGLLFGGFDTTGSALAWTLALLPQHPDVVERLRVEADGVGDRIPAYAETLELEYTKAVFDEAQRIQGALLLTREALADDEIGGAPVRAGTLVGVSSYSLHRNPEFWRAPEQFDPDRFVGPARAAQHRYQFLPFGAGPRHCIGANLAYLEATLALTAITKRFYVQPVPGYVPRPRFHLSTGLKGGLPCTIRRRSAPATTASGGRIAPQRREAVIEGAAQES
jgi:cytochrome P450